MFAIVMFYANPLIDGGNGSGLIKLQLAYDKEAGIEIINSWGASGIDHFNQWIFTDYIYAFSYAVFFASLLSILIMKKGKEEFLVYRFGVYLAFVAGLLDWIENTMELFFVNNYSGFPSALFFLHSIVATVKWAALPVAVAYIVVLLANANKPDIQIR
jgi:Na+/citrate or Na+/malate symporter